MGRVRVAREAASADAPRCSSTRAKCFFSQIRKPVVQADRDAQFRFGLFIPPGVLMGDAGAQMIGVRGIVLEHDEYQRHPTFVAELRDVRQVLSVPLRRDTCGGLSRIDCDILITGGFDQM